MIVALLLLFALACAVVEPATAPATTSPSPSTASTLYDVRFTRPGDLRPQHLSMNIGYRRDWVVRRGERVVHESRDEFTLEFAGYLEVRQSERGQPTKIAMRIDRFERIRGIERQAVLPAGKTILIQRDGKTIKYALEDGPLPQGTERFVRMLRTVPRAGEPDSDEIYGPHSRALQPIGASWAIDTAKYSRMAAAADVRIEPNDIEGTARLVAATQHDGIPCLQIEADASADDVKIPSGDSWRQTSGRVRESFALLAPIDIDLPTVASSSVWEASYTFVRHVGEDEIREQGEDHIVRLREVKSRAD